MGEGGVPEPGPAAQVADPELRWLPLPVHGDLPLTAEELLRLVRLHARQTPEHDRRRRQAFPPEEAVPTAEQVATLADRVTRADLAARQLDPGLRDVLDRPDAGQVLEVIRDVKARLEEVLRHRRTWVVRAADLALGDPKGADWRRLEQQPEEIQRLLDTAAELGETLVEGVEASEETLQAVTTLQAELDTGAPTRRWFRGKAQRSAARLLEEAVVDGEPVTDAAGAAAVRRFLEVAASAEALEDTLEPWGVSIPPMQPREAMVEGWSVIRDALRAITRLAESSRRLGDVLGPGPMSLLPVKSLEGVEQVGWVGDALSAVREGVGARQELESAALKLEESTARIVAADDLEQAAPEVAELVLCLRAAADTAYAEWLSKMEAGRRARRLGVLRVELLDRLEESAPRLPALFEGDVTEARWEPRIARWAEAWEAARVATEAAEAAAVAEAEAEAVAAAATEDSDGAAGVAPAQPAGDPREVILELAARGPVSGAEVREATGLSPAQSRTLLKRLVDDGELVRTGATSATRWHRPE